MSAPRKSKAGFVPGPGRSLGALMKPVQDLPSWALLAGIFCVCPAVAWAQDVDSRYVMSISAAFVNVPAGMIVLSMAIRNYIRLKRDLAPSVRTLKSIGKVRLWTVVLTLAAVFTVFAEPMRHPTISNWWLGLLLATPNVLLGLASLNFAGKLKQKYTAPDPDIVPQDKIPVHKTVLITGGNRGLGYQCAWAMAREAGWHVLLACRKPHEATDAVELLRRDCKRSRVDAVPLDLASCASIQALAQTIIDGPYPPLRAIVCNAGLQLVGDTSYTEDGFEMTFGVNHLGHLMLVRLLLEHLTPPARIVFVSSGTHDPAQRTGMPAPQIEDAAEMARPSQETLAREKPGQAGRRRYATSKLCNILCAYELHRKLQESGLSSSHAPITVNAFDPGLMPGTGLARDYSPLLRMAWHYALPTATWFIKGVNTTRASGQNLARLLLDPALEKTSGKYFVDEQEARSSEESYDAEKAAALWSQSLELLQLDEIPGCQPKVSSPKTP